MNKVLLCILDGVGISDRKEGNAFYNANTPMIDSLINKYSNKNIDASGNSVGLPDGQMGNSEVGHLTLGTGRVIFQSLELINQSIKNNDFFSNESFINAINHAKNNNSKLHILGLLSDGGVHSHINHIKALLQLCSKENFNEVYFHVFTDGRDTYSENGIKYLNELECEIKKYGIGKISTISGRYYAMDRDKRYDRVKDAYDALIGENTNASDDYELYMKKSYENDITDEFIKPVILDINGKIEDNDSIIWANFRPDRAIEILSALTNDNFDGFDRKKINNIYLTTMMYVSDNIKSDIAFKTNDIDNTLGIYLSKLNKKQLRIAETEKYAHVTYFFDGGKDLNLEGCKRILVPSPKVPTYDLKPEMSAEEITDNLLIELENNYDFILLNFANGDMVGHTGSYDAAVKAVETLDVMLKRIYNKCNEYGYTLIVTADHGNCECMLDVNNNIVTSHTNNKVPFIVCAETINIDSVDKLSDIAPFILNLLKIDIPEEMK